MRRLLWNQRALGMGPGLARGRGLAARLGVRARMGLAGQQGVGTRQGLGAGSGLRGTPGRPSLLQVLQKSQARLVRARTDNARDLLDLVEAFGGGLGARGAAYGLRALEGETTGTTTTPTPAQYFVDPASLRTVVSGTLYTINGSVTGPTAGQARIRVWLGNASTGGKLLDPTTGSETLVSGYLVIELPSGNNTFSLTIDLMTLPANASKPPSTSSPWVITASDTSGNDESDPMLVPLTSMASFSVDPTTLVSTSANNVITIAGAVKEPTNTPAAIRVWMGTPAGQKQVSSTFAEILVASTQALLSGGTGNFSLAVNLAAPTPGALAPTPSAPWVITASDQMGGYESTPVIVPTPGAAPVPSAFALDAASLKATSTGNIITLTGTVKEPNNTPAVVRIWMGTPAGQKATTSPSFSETLVGGTQVALSAGSANFSIAIDLNILPGGAAAPKTDAPWVITVCDQYGGNETLPILVPAATAATQVASFTFDASTLKATIAGSIVAVTGTLKEPNSIAGVVRLWMGNSLGQKQLMPPLFQETLVGGASVALTAGNGNFSIDIDLNTLTAPAGSPTPTSPWVITACDQSGAFETAPLTVPQPVAGSSSGTSVTVPPVTVPPPTPVVPMPGDPAEPLTAVEGIGKEIASVFRTANVHTTIDLLNMGGTPSGRRKLAKATKFKPSQILEWVNRVDLFRLAGVDEQFSDLLENAGVDSVVELARRNAENLHEKLVETNARKKLTRVVPSQKTIQKWIDQAKTLPRVVGH